MYVDEFIEYISARLEFDWDSYYKTTTWQVFVLGKLLTYKTTENNNHITDMTSKLHGLE
jgi:hypothetical protein